MAGQMLLINPKGRKRRAGGKKKVRRAGAKRSGLAVYRKKVKRARKGFGRNPIGGGFVKNVVSTTMDSAIGAGGALLTAVVASKIPMPDALKGPVATPLVNGALGIGLGLLISQLKPMRRVGEQVAAGSLTVTIYDALRGAMGPKLGLSGYGDLLAYDEVNGYGDLLAYDSMGAYDNPAAAFDPSSMSEYGYDTANGVE